MGKKQSKQAVDSDLYDLEGVDLLTAGNGSTLDMSASWEISQGYHRAIGKTITVWAVTLHSKLSGNLVDGAYY